MLFPQAKSFVIEFLSEVCRETLIRSGFIVNDVLDEIYILVVNCCDLEMSFEGCIVESGVYVIWFVVNIPEVIYQVNADP